MEYQSITEPDSHQMYDLAKRLYPVCRSITGDGVRETLAILNEYIELKVREVPSGTKVFDWEIPDEWNIREAWIKNSDGEIIVDFKKLNLHVVNYSIPVNKKLKLTELKAHLHSLPDYPEWVPYRTSYYKREWGFCLSHQQLEKLKEGDYYVNIDSSLNPGSLTYGEFFIKGESDKEILFSCHICHPSLCNDNLSGIVVSTWLAEYLKKLKLNYSYRFLFIPGTIGSITWLALNESKLHQIKHGLVLTLLGDESAFHYKRTRQGDAEIDNIVEYLLHREGNSKILDFSPYGYDERQYGSPGFNLPVGRLSRKPFGEFPEYHTSADNLGFIKAVKLGESFQLLTKIVHIIENNSKWINTNPKCEPQLGKRGLYNSPGGQSHQNEYHMALLWILNLSDGNHSLLDIAMKSKVDFEVLLQAKNQLLKFKLLKKLSE